MGLSFFGLTSSTAAIARQNLFTQIHEIVFHGKGGYDWVTVYNMPRWLRQFTFNKINEFYQEEAKAHEDAQGGKSTNIIDSSGKINRGNYDAMKNPSKPVVKYK